DGGMYAGELVQQRRHRFVGGGLVAQIPGAPAKVIEPDDIAGVEIHQGGKPQLLAAGYMGAEDGHANLQGDPATAGIAVPDENEQGVVGGARGLELLGGCAQCPVENAAFLGGQLQGADVV